MIARGSARRMLSVVEAAATRRELTKPRTMAGSSKSRMKLERVRVSPESVCEMKAPRTVRTMG
jgi:hypothetical protein